MNRKVSHQLPHHILLGEVAMAEGTDVVEGLYEVVAEDVVDEVAEEEILQH